MAQTAALREKNLRAQHKIMETIKLLDEESFLKLYDLALTFQNSKQQSNRKEFNFDNIRRSQIILSSIKGSLSDDIELDREDRC